MLGKQETNPKRSSESIKILVKTQEFIIQVAKHLSKNTNPNRDEIMRVTERKAAPQKRCQTTKIKILDNQTIIHNKGCI